MVNKIIGEETHQYLTVLRVDNVRYRTLNENDIAKGGVGEILMRVQIRRSKDRQVPDGFPCSRKNINVGTQKCVLRSIAHCASEKMEGTPHSKRV